MNILPGLGSIFWFSILALIPFVIHFYKKWRRRKVYFAPIFLFKEEMRQANKSIRFRSNIISVLRAIILILIVFLLAKPLTSEEYRVWSLDKDKTAVTLILIDNSRSMDYFYHNETVYQRAIRHTEGLIRELPHSNSIMLIELASQLNLPIEITSDRDKLIKRLRHSRVRPLNRPMAQNITELFKEIHQQNIRVRELFLLSDFQRSDWSGVKLPNSVPAVLVRLSDEEVSNMAITRVIVDDSVHLSSVGGHVRVSVKNHGKEKAANYVSLLIHGKLVAKEEILLGPGKETTITAKIKSQTSQWAFGQANLMYDRYSHDNKQSFEMFFKNSFHILFLENRDFPLLSYSLKSSIMSQFSKYKSRIRFHNQRDYSINSYDYIICNRLSYMTQEEIHLLRDALEKKIPVLILLNQKDSPYGVNRVLRMLGLSNELSVLLFKRYKGGEVLRLNPEPGGKNSFHKHFSHIGKSGSIRSHFIMRYQNKSYNPLLKVKNTAFLIQSAHSKRNLTIATGGMNRLNSEILFNQWFPLMLNWVFNEGIRQNLKSQKDIFPDSVDSYVSESDLKLMSASEMRKLSGNDFVTVTNDAVKWLKSRSVRGSKSLMLSNTFLEYVILILVLLFLLMELVLSYPVHHKLALKRNP